MSLPLIVFSSPGGGPVSGNQIPDSGRNDRQYRAIREIRAKKSFHKIFLHHEK